MPRNTPLLLCTGLMLLTAACPLAIAAKGSADLVITRNGFKPDRLNIAAGKRVRLQVANRSGLPAEFEGRDFTVEKVIPAGTALPVYIGPLKPGTYHFFNDFAPTSKGRLQVK